MKKISNNPIHRLAVIYAALVLFILVTGCHPSFEKTTMSFRDLQESKTRLVLALAGDVLLSPNVSRRSRTDLENDCNDYTTPVRPAIPFVSDADIALCNLESPLSLEGAPVQGRSWNFRSAPSKVNTLTTLGFDVIGIANNHILDYGGEAFLDTLKHLQAANLLYTGVSTDGETQEPVIVEAKGLRVAFLAYNNVYPADYYGESVRPLRATQPRLAADIPRAKSAADIVVVTIHWGKEYSTTPSREQINLGRTMIDLGASVVAGHHPHLVQEPELYKGGVIIYCLGNFLFQQARLRTPQTRLYRVFLDRQGVARVTYIPFRFKTNPWRMDYRPFSIVEWMRERPPQQLASS